MMSIYGSDTLTVFIVIHITPALSDISRLLSAELLKGSKEMGVNYPHVNLHRIPKGIREKNVTATKI